MDTYLADHNDNPLLKKVLALCHVPIISRIFHAGVVLGLPDIIENQGPKSAYEIGEEIGAHPESIYRLMRALSSQGCFVEGENGVFSKNELSTCLTNSPKGNMRHHILVECGDLHFGILLNLVDTIKSGKSQVHQGLIGQKSYWEVHNASQDVFVTFAELMTVNTLRHCHENVRNSDFSGARVVCDLGASQGVLIREILRQNPHIEQGISFDIPTIIEANKNLVREGDEMARFKEVEGSFLESVPYADIFTLKLIFHNWSNEQSKTILENIKRANPKAKVFIYDGIIESKNVQSYGTIFDIKMFHFLDGRERSVDDWRALAESAGFKVTLFNNKTIRPGFIAMDPTESSESSK